MSQRKNDKERHPFRILGVVFLLIIIAAGCFWFCMNGGLFRVLSLFGKASTPQSAMPSTEMVTEMEVTEPDTASEVTEATETTEEPESQEVQTTAFAEEDADTIHIAQTPEESTDTEAASETDESEEATAADPGETTAAATQTTADGEIIDPNLISTHMILVKPDSNQIVAEKDGYEKIVPASMTKIMTLLVAAEQVDPSKMSDTVTVSLETCDYCYLNDCSVAGFYRDEVVTVQDLFYGMILPSGADAVLEMCSYVAGSQEEFVKLMNEKAQELGIADTTHFTNAIGLYDEDHYSTCYDMALILNAAMQNETARKILGTRTYTTSKTDKNPEGLCLSNWFLRRIEDRETGAEVEGAKTGYVKESGSCAASYEVREDGTPLICVTTGSAGSWKCIYDHVEVYDTYGRS